ncbi:MAG TPA: DUF6282 family protein [Actinomycetota bacterium]|nr:DUF6282 family protein [Actinomycetota bacterium]
MSDPAAVDRILRGAVDPHCHPFPSPYPRRIDVKEAAEHYAAAGFRAFVAKSHHHSTAPDVALLKRHGLDEIGVEVLGAVALNNHVGGLNPHAVNLCLAQGGRVVWMPTISAPNHIEHARATGLKFPTLTIPLIDDEPIDVFVEGEGSRLRDEVHDVLRMVADADAVLASGHIPAPWILAVFEAARDAGVTRMVLNHPNFVIEATKEEVAKIADLGAVVEHSLCMYDEDSTFHQWELVVLLDWIALVGPERTQLGSDLGQRNNPLPVESYRKLCGRMLDAGMGEREIRMMVADNPARLLGL